MLIGNVGRDPEVRYLDGNGAGSQGRKVASFTLATSERYRDRNGELRENTEWHNIVVWRGLAEVVEKHVRKGTQVYIEGKITYNQWVDKAKVSHVATEIIADTLQLLGKKPDEQPAPLQVEYKESASEIEQLPKAGDEDINDLAF